MKKEYLVPQTESLEITFTNVLAASPVLGGEGKDNVEFEAPKREFEWNERTSESYWE